MAKKTTKKTTKKASKSSTRAARPTRKKRTVAAAGATRGGTAKRRKAPAKKATTKTATKKKRTPAKTTTTRKPSTTRKAAPKKKPAAKRAPANKQRPQSAGPLFTAPQKALFIGVLLIAITAILILSLLSPTQGSVTASLFTSLKLAFGLGAWLVPLMMGSFGLYLVLWGIGQPPRFSKTRLAGLMILFVTFEALATLASYATNNGLNDVWQIARAQAGGGYFGGVLTWATIKAVGDLGSAFLFLIASVFGLILFSGFSRLELGAWMRQIMQRGEETVARHEPKGKLAKLRERDDRQIPPNPAVEGRPTVAVIRERVDTPIFDPHPEQAVEIDRIEEIRQRRREQKELELAAAVEQPVRPKKTSKKASKPESQPTAPAVVAGSHKGNWTLPVISKMLLLGDSNEVEDTSIREQVAVIEQTLESFGAPVKTVEINTGPTVTQFGVEPLYLESRSGRRTKVKVSKIAGLADDLALALAAKSVRVQAPVPGKGYIGIEVPNTAKITVSLRDAMESQNFANIKSPLRIGLGQDVAGNPVSADLAKMPHLLIAGATGSGKSVCVNGIIACLLLQNTPAELRFVMVDPKRVELTGYNGIPHLAAPVVVDMDRVVGVLQWALREMDSRYQTFATVGSRNIISFNEKAEKAGKDKLPYMVIIIDELADLMMTAPDDTERALARLAQMARATGIHMIIATQRPSVDVVTGLIKANFPARIAFAVSSSTDSRVVLDTTGAERLLGAGDMLLQKPDSPAPMRMQGCYVSDEELVDLISYWKLARRNFKYTVEDAQPRDALLGVPVQKLASPAVAEPVKLAPAAIPQTNKVVKKAQQATIRESGGRGSQRRAAPVKVVRAKQPKKAQRPEPPLPFEEVAFDEGVSAEIQPQPKSAPKQPKRAKIRPAPAAVPKPKSKPKPKAQPEPELFEPEAELFESEPEFIEEAQQPLWEDLIDMDKLKKEQEIVDELWDDAVAFVQKAGKASTSMLQRRFRIGYTRSARIIDAMEDNGVIGPPTGTSKAREVLLKPTDSA